MWCDTQKPQCYNANVAVEGLGQWPSRKKFLLTLFCGRGNSILLSNWLGATLMRNVLPPGLRTCSFSHRWFFQGVLRPDCRMCHASRHDPDTRGRRFHGCPRCVPPNRIPGEMTNISWSDAAIFESAVAALYSGGFSPPLWHHVLHQTPPADQVIPGHTQEKPNANLAKPAHSNWEGGIQVEEIAPYPRDRDALCGAATPLRLLRSLLPNYNSVCVRWNRWHLRVPKCQFWQLLHYLHRMWVRMLREFLLQLVQHRQLHC